MTQRLTSRGGGASILGISMDGERLEAIALRRTNESVEVRRTFVGALSLDPLTNDPQLVGRELRKHLDAAGIRERRCAVCIPAEWILTVQVRLPELPEEDIQSFVQLEAERGFPYSPENLMMCESRFRAGPNEAYSTLLAVPREHVNRLEAALVAAQLRPVSFSIGIDTILPDSAESSEGTLTLMPGTRGVQLLVTTGKGIAMLRTLENVYEPESARPILQQEALGRELRISLGQLPVEVRQDIRRLRIVGSGDLANDLGAALETKAAAWKMRLQSIREYSPGNFQVSLPPGTTVSAALSAGVNQLTGVTPRLEFLPPRVSAWQQFAARYSSRKLAWSGAAGAAVLAVLTIAFGIQQYRLWRLETQWKRMEKRVTELEKIQQNIRHHRPWFDESYRSLNVLRRLTEAFPEDGAVSAKNVEIRAPATVICSGTAQSQQALMNTLEKLRATREIAEVKLEQSHGQSPVDFTFNFQWADAGSSL